MKLKILKVVIVAMLLACPSEAQEEEGAIPRLWKRLTGKGRAAQSTPAPSATPAKGAPPGIPAEPIPVLTKEEMLSKINNMIKTDHGILADMPQLKKKTGEDGKDFYVYMEGDKEIKPEDLEEDRVRELLSSLVKKETIAFIKSTIELDEEVLASIPELKKKTGEDGKVFYVYMDGDKEVDLGDLEEGRLMELLGNAQNQSNAYQASMVTQQIQAMTQAQKISEIAQMTHASPPPPLPQPPPQPPRPPAPPPQPPRR